MARKAHQEPANAPSVPLLPGLGPGSRAMLAAAGVHSLHALTALGAVRAYLLVKQAGAKPSLNLLWGLESAISGEHWREVAREHRTSLLLALEQAEKNLDGHTPW